MNGGKIDMKLSFDIYMKRVKRHELIFNYQSVDTKCTLASEEKEKY